MHSLSDGCEERLLLCDHSFLAAALQGLLEVRESRPKLVNCLRGLCLLRLGDLGKDVLLVLVQGAGSFSDSLQTNGQETGLRYL